MHTGSEKYRTPDPETGVFVPDEHNGGNHSKNDLRNTLQHTAGDCSLVLEQTTWIRQLEEVDKPLPNLEEK